MDGKSYFSQYPAFFQVISKQYVGSFCLLADGQRRDRTLHLLIVGGKQVTNSLLVFILH